jgi:hypothetical protein
MTGSLGIPDIRDFEIDSTPNAVARIRSVRLLV